MNVLYMKTIREIAEIINVDPTIIFWYFLYTSSENAAAATDTIIGARLAMKRYSSIESPCPNNIIPQNERTIG